jgi:hypothetical protein
MMTRFSHFLFFSFMGALVLTCNAPEPIAIALLNGYWKIEFVEEKGEQFIPQAVAPLYDYYYVENQKGFKKKVAPALVGKLQTSDTEIPFSINQNNHSFVLHYQSQWDVWESNIVQLDSQRLILKEGARKYFYQRVRPNPISNE